MTVTNTTNRIKASGDGAIVAFDFAFKIFNDTDLLVYKVVDSTDVATLQVLNTDYTVEILGSGEGGTVTYTVAPTTLESSLLIRELTFDQNTDIPTESNFPEAAINNSLDKLTMLSQQLEDRLERTLSLDLTADAVTITFPSADADKAIKWNAAGTALENSTYDPDNTGDAEAAATEAAASAAAAEASAARINLPEIDSGDAGKLNVVNAAGDGYDLSTETLTELKTSITEAEDGAIPVGGTLWWNGETAPTNFFPEDGRSLVRLDYPVLFTAIGTLHGAADSTHFNIPNTQGRFIRAWDNGEGVDPNAASRTAGASGGATGDHVGTVQEDEVEDPGLLLMDKNQSAVNMPSGSGEGSYSTTTFGGDETRPKNIYKMACIRYQ